MTIDASINDPTLLPLLEVSHAALSQAQKILDWLESNTASSPPTLEAQLRLSKQQKLLHAYLAKLRGLHRHAALDARATKQETAEARTEVDRLLLQLQNLYYEQRHLIGEIDACEGYDHAYMRLPLIPTDEFLALFPDQGDSSEQALMPLRIEHEKQEREKMELQRLELVKVKEALVKENTRKKDELRKMDEKLEVMIDGLRPLEEALTKDI
jgi:hypothetical protein